MNEVTYSKHTFESFEPLDYSFEVFVQYNRIYKQLEQIIPNDTSSFFYMPLEYAIACETICAVICHNINWDFLRDAVAKAVCEGYGWILPQNLANITEQDVWNILAAYNKPERILAAERADILRQVGEWLLKLDKGFEDLFFEQGHLRGAEEIEGDFSKCEPFWSDPQKKKYRLLLQSLSDDERFSGLEQCFEPAIDYHLIRMYLRRGVVAPKNTYAKKYIFNKAVHREDTIAALRAVCAKSLRLISWATEYSIKDINRIEWWVGRSICKKGCPDCQLKSADGEWVKHTYDKCPFYEVCHARSESDEKWLKIDEPEYQGKSY